MISALAGSSGTGNPISYFLITFGITIYTLNLPLLRNEVSNESNRFVAPITMTLLYAFSSVFRSKDESDLTTNKDTIKTRK